MAFGVKLANSLASISVEDQGLPGRQGNMFILMTDSQSAQNQYRLGSRASTKRARAIKVVVRHWRSTVPFWDCRPGGDAPTRMPFRQRKAYTFPFTKLESKSHLIQLGMPPASMKNDHSASMTDSALFVRMP
jgi:hypothetical protein